MRIEDYALIGDGRTAALVGRNGSIDWLCWPNFASDACFASLLGSEKNGFWRLAPVGEVTRTSRRYEPHTLILETTYDPRIQGTVTAIQQHLTEDGLVMRYDTSKAGDGLPGSEGKFLACSFWLVTNLKLVGRDDEAKALFEKLLSLATDTGLLSEEYNTHRNRLVGNFPQAFSHIALIGAAYHLAETGNERHSASLVISEPGSSNE